MSANQPRQPSGQHHYTPPWLDWIATNVVPSAMILAELIIITGFFIVTSVRKPYEPQAWSYLEWALVIVAGFVGLAMAGLALKLSGQAAEMLATNHYMRGAFTFAGVLVLALIETWAGIVERAQTIGIGPADLLLADYTGINAFRSIPTSVFMVAFILPCLVLWYGWASRPPVVISAEEQAATHQKKLADARFKAELNEIRAGGAARTAVAFKNGITGKKDEPLPESGTPVHPEVIASSTREKPAKFSASRVPGKKTAKQWTAADLQAYVTWAYDRVLDDITAGNMVRSLGGNQQIVSLVGKPYYANNLTAKGWADKVYGRGQEASLVESEAAG
jgi:hypothetical protein